MGQTIGRAPLPAGCKRFLNCKYFSKRFLGRRDLYVKRKDDAPSKASWLFHPPVTHPSERKLLNSLLSIFSKTNISSNNKNTRTNYHILSTKKLHLWSLGVLQWYCRGFWTHNWRVSGDNQVCSYGVCWCDGKDFKYRHRDSIPAIRRWWGENPKVLFLDFLWQLLIY